MYYCNPSYGEYIGRLTETVAGVSGDLYAVDKTTIFVANFSHSSTDPGTGTGTGTGTLETNVQLFMNL